MVKLSWVAALTFPSVFPLFPGFYSNDIHSDCTEWSTRRLNPTHHPSLCLQLVKVFSLPRGEDSLFIIAQETISCLFSLLPFPLPAALGWCSLYSYGLWLWLWLHSLLEVFFPGLNVLIAQPPPSLVFVQGLLFVFGGGGNLPDHNIFSVLHLVHPLVFFTAFILLLAIWFFWNVFSVSPLTTVLIPSWRIYISVYVVFSILNTTHQQWALHEYMLKE